VKGIRADETTRYSNYQKFNVATIATIGKPKGADADAPATANPGNEAAKPQ
jgi:hypothetical protein